MSQRYSFVTLWLLDTDIASVWDCILAVEKWPEWWPAVREVAQLAPGDKDGVGTVTRFTWRGRLPYGLTFDMRIAEIVPHRRLSGVASGELQGIGIWHFAETPYGIRVQYDWTVITNKAWMNLLAPLFRPAFRWNHDHIMSIGGEGIARRLGCRVQAIQ